MSTFVVQAASKTVLHCYIRGKTGFDCRTVVARVASMQALRGAHLVTTGRSDKGYCLVLEPKIAVEQGNAEALRRLVSIIRRRIGCTHLELARPLCRPRAEQGRATDIYDWLKW